MSTGIIKAIDLASEWLKINGVEGVAEGDFEGEPCLVVLISVPQVELTEKIPSNFLGYQVVYEDSGSITAQ